MSNQEIFELMARFDASAATSFKLTTKDFSLELGKGGGAAAPVYAAPAAQAAAPAAAPAACRRPGGGARGPVHHRPPGGHLLRRLRPRRRPLRAGGRPRKEGPDRVPDGGHEDDERGAGPL